MEQDREPLKVPLGQEWEVSIKESKVARNVCMFGFLLCRIRGDGKVVHENMEQEGEQSQV